MKKALAITTLLLSGSIHAEEYSPFVIGGEVANQENFKYYASIHYNYGFSCGASILNDRYILTAAHCVTNQGYNNVKFTPIPASELTVKVKNHDEYQVTYQEELKAVKNVYIHEQWDYRKGYVTDTDGDGINDADFDVTYTRGYDIAVIELAHPITDNVQSITLPTSYDLSTIYSDLNWTLIGRGNYDKNGAVVSGGHTIPLLSGAVLGHDDQTTCEDKFHANGECLLLKTEEPFNNGGACRGDSGGPLTYFTNEGHYQQVGIVSYGPTNCLASDFYSINNYTNIHPFNKWINSKITGIVHPLAYVATENECKYSNGDHGTNPEWLGYYNLCGKTSDSSGKGESTSGSSTSSSGGSAGLFTLLGLALFGLRRKIIMRK